MSVLPCQRNGCNNIMCNRYSNTYGYICEECFEELITHGRHIGDFMATPKKHNNDNDDGFMAWQKLVEDEFPISRTLD